MKKFMKTAGWQIGAFVLAIGAAFATNVMKDTTFFATEMGYQKMNLAATDCEPRIECSTNLGLICTWQEGTVSHPLFGRVKISTDVFKCDKPLYKP